MFLELEVKKEISLARSFNAQNGNDSEVQTASNILQALGAEIRWASRNEDNAKIDILVSFDHPWMKFNRMLLSCQVKSGDCYGNVLSDDKILFKKRAYDEAKRSLNNIFFVWFDHNKKDNYWDFITPNTVSSSKEMGKNHKLTPATRFELARILVKHTRLLCFNSRGLILDLSQTKGLKTTRADLKTKYRGLREILNPQYGNIAFTNFGWDHMFRASRLLKYKKQSVLVIPYLQHLLQFQPNRTWINRYSYKEYPRYALHSYEHVLRYEGIKTNVMSNTAEYEIVIKLIEEVAYPIDWKRENLLTQRVKRKVVFKSCSLKKMA